MRGLPFFKAKNKPQFAGLNFSDGSGGGGGSYTLPTATASRLGGVKIGSGVSVTEDGTISVTDSGFSHYHLTTLTDGTVIDTNCSDFDYVVGKCKCKTGANEYVYPVCFNDYEKISVYIHDGNLELHTNNVSGYTDISLDIYVKNLVKTS